jgi:hypothetical protein
LSRAVRSSLRGHGRDEVRRHHRRRGLGGRSRRSNATASTRVIAAASSNLRMYARRPFLIRRATVPQGSLKSAMPPSEDNDRAASDVPALQVAERFVDLLQAIPTGHQFVEWKLAFLVPAYVHREVTLWPPAASE